jgi:hypothetical protein
MDLIQTFITALNKYFSSTDKKLTRSFLSCGMQESFFFTMLAIGLKT